MSKIIIYGIPNCDATKKAMAWLGKNKIAFLFHDYKQQGISKQKLEKWFDIADWETIFNRRSTTWRELTAAEQDKVTSPSSAIQLMIKSNSIIKRPIIEMGNDLLIGFNEIEYSRAFK